MSRAAVAVLFPGQGSERPQMGLDLVDRSPVAQALFDEVGALTGIPPRQLLRSGGAAWRRSDIMQPLLVAVCLAFWHEIADLDLTPGWLAGHSLGGVTAWAAAGGISALGALRLAAERGQLMSACAQTLNGGMLALSDADELEVQAAVRDGRAHGELHLAGRNGPKQWLVSGSQAALLAVAARYASTRLPAAGPWHCPLMRNAAGEFAERLSQRAERPLERRLLGATGLELDDKQARAELPEQLCRPFDLHRALKHLHQQGVRQLITVGPARPLRALVRANLGRAVTLIPLETVRDLAALATRLRA